MCPHRPSHDTWVLSPSLHACWFPMQRLCVSIRTAYPCAYVLVSRGSSNSTRHTCIHTCYTPHSFAFICACACFQVELKFNKTYMHTYMLHNTFIRIHMRMCLFAGGAQIQEEANERRQRQRAETT